MSLAQRLNQHMLVPPWGSFQVRGVRFLEKHNGRAIIGDDMGLGKTYQAIAYHKIHPEVRPWLIVCPATVKWKWQRELLEFAGLESTVIGPHKPYGVDVELWEEKIGEGNPRQSRRWFTTVNQVEAFLSENWHRLKLINHLEREFPPLKDIVIINYDILADWHERLLVKLRPSSITVDEAQKVKNPKAKRTKFVQSLAQSCFTIIGLSGTLLLSRPIELYPILNIIDPIQFKSYNRYAFRYCAPKRGYRGRGWDFSGASNLEELHEKLKSVMIRRMKSEVLKDLPTKVRSIIPVEITNWGEYEEARDSLITWLTEKKGRAAALRAVGAPALVKIGALKLLAAQGKIDAVCSWIIDFLDETGQKLVVFAVHKIIVSHLMNVFPHAVKIDGDIPPEKRQGIVDRFQNDPGCRLFIGNLDAAGTAITLTAASTVVFAELGWTPAEHDQAGDRCLRIGQTADRMEEIYFVGKDTIEEKVLGLINKKRGIVSQVLDGKEADNVIEHVIDTLLKEKGKE